MYEIFSTISDEYGVRDVPTGQGSINANIANGILDEFKQKYPKVYFYVEWVQPEDWDCAY